MFQFKKGKKILGQQNGAVSVKAAAFSDDPNDLFDMWIEYQKHLEKVEKTGDERKWEEAVREVISDYMEMGAACREKGGLYNAPGRYLYNAQDHYRKACTLGERLCKKTGTAEDFRNLFLSYYEYGESCMVYTDMDEADRYFQKAVELGEKLLTEEGVKSVRRPLLRCYYQMGFVREFGGSYLWARELYKKAVTYCEELYEEQETPTSCKDLALFCYKAGTADKSAPDKDYLRRSLAMYHRLLELEPENKEAKAQIPVVEKRLKEAGG